MKFLKDNAYINGKWVAGKKTFEVTNPATQNVLAHVADLGEAETNDAIKAAQQAFPAWSAQPAKERSKILRKWFNLIMANKTDLGKLLTAEQGKPVKEAIGEIVYGAGFIEWFAEEGKRTYGDIIPNSVKGSRILALKQPVGVVAAITPWNFPNAMIARKVAPALAAGCTVVIKPASETPLSALALALLAEEAGMPAGVLNIVTTTDAKTVGEVLCKSETVKKLSFTGSTAVGKILYAACADTVKKISLELGGNAPFIVFDDADVDSAVQGAMVSKYRNGGQTCICANRFYVQSGIYDAFIEKFAAEVAKLQVGDGAKEGTDVGPLINQKGLEKVENLVADAQQKGAKVALGGNTLKGTFYEPTVITNAKANMKFSQEEIFGPVAPIFKFETDEEVIELANNTKFGLASYFYSNNLSRIWRTAEALEYGMVGVNTGLISEVQAPFGGIKESGFGREGSKYGIEDYMHIKYINLSGIM